MKVKLVWSTPDGDNLLGYMARVSNPNATKDDNSEKLIKYLIDHKHWSPLEMVNACVEIETTRDIGRQILRHPSFRFQEFSQRYAEVDQVEPSFRPARLQDPENRQNSIEIPEENNLQEHWRWHQKEVFDFSMARYQDALKCGIAKEQARALLPEGLTNTRMFMSGSLRSWVHYWGIRCSSETQLEHRLVANQTRDIILAEYPKLQQALYEKESVNA